MSAAGLGEEGRQKQTINRGEGADDAWTLEARLAGTCVVCFRHNRDSGRHPELACGLRAQRFAATGGGRRATDHGRSIQLAQRYACVEHPNLVCPTALATRNRLVARDTLFLESAVYLRR